MISLQVKSERNWKRKSAQRCTISTIIKYYSNGQQKKQRYSCCFPIIKINNNNNKLP